MTTTILPDQLCPNCEGAHHVQQCPELRKAMTLPPDPREAVRDYEGYLSRAHLQYAAATTAADRRDAQQWIDNAQRGLAKWRAVAERLVTR